MNATVEIDKAGRIVLPKKMRDALHLVPGTRITLVQNEDSILMQSEQRPRGLYLKDGMPVYSFGRSLPPDHVNWVEQAREERDEDLMGTWQNDRVFRQQCIDRGISS